MARVFSTHPIHPEATARLTAATDYRVASAPTPAAILAEGLDADVIVVRAPIPPDYFRQAGNLRAAVRHGAGLDMVPMDDAAAAGVIVANVPGANAATVAEHALLMALLHARQFRAVDAALRSDGWAAARAHADQARDLGGRVIGILGFGNIARALYGMATGMGMTVAATTRTPAHLPPGVRAMDLGALMAASDVVVIACPLTDATRGLIDAALLARMKPGAVLINVARGPIVQTEALIAALRDGRISAALDVFDTQPLPANSPLWHLPNVILTPHQAGITEDSMRRMGAVTADEVLRILSGALPLNFCNPGVEPRYRARFPR